MKKCNVNVSAFPQDHISHLELYINSMEKLAVNFHNNGEQEVASAFNKFAEFSKELLSPMKNLVSVWGRKHPLASAVPTLLVMLWTEMTDLIYIKFNFQTVTLSVWAHRLKSKPFVKSCFSCILKKTMLSVRLFLRGWDLCHDYSLHFYHLSSHS